MGIKLWPRELHLPESIWVPSYDERQRLLEDRELLETPITDIAVGDIVLDHRFSMVHSIEPSISQVDQRTLGFSVSTLNEDGKVYQGWFYPYETILKANLDATTIKDYAPIAQMVERGVLAS